jgi:hypothetical protein
VHLSHRMVPRLRILHRLYVISRSSWNRKLLIRGRRCSTWSLVRQASVDEEHVTGYMREIHQRKGAGND